MQSTGQSFRFAGRPIRHGLLCIAVTSLLAIPSLTRAQGTIELEKVQLAALTSTVFTDNSDLKVKVTAIFSDGTQEDVTHYDRCSWDTGKYSRDKVWAADGKVAIGSYMEDRFFTVQASYTDNKKTVKSNPLTFIVHDDCVFVPELDEKTEAEAVALLRKKGLKEIIKKVMPSWQDDKIVLYNFNGPGTVWEQDPWRGELLQKGSTVTLFIFPRAVPDLSGQTIAEAQEDVKRIGLNLKIESAEAQTFDPTFDPGNIISQIPPYGTLITKDIKKLFVTVNKMGVPDLSDCTIPEAQEKLKKFGFNLKIESVQAQVFDYIIDPGRIISQDPAAGTVVTKDLKKILLVLNKDAMEMPDLKGKTESEARKLLKKVKPEITVKQGSLYYPQYGPGTVVSSLPGKNVILPQGGKVCLILNAPAPAPSATPTSIVPQTASAVAPSPPPLPRMGIKVKEKLSDGSLVTRPLSRTYQPGVDLTFREDLDRDQGLKIDYTWYIGGKLVGTGVEISRILRQPGTHTVQLVAEAKTLGWKDAIIRVIHIEYPPDPELSIRVSNFTIPFEPGQVVDLIAVAKNLPKGKLTWYVNGEEVGTGSRVNNFVLKEKGNYKIVLEFQEVQENFPSLKAEMTIVVGDPPIGLMGRNRNRFQALGAPGNLRIQSSKWQYGMAWSNGLLPVKSIPAKWTDWITFRTVGSVDAYDLYTGIQLGSYNTGFLVYMPAGTDPPEIRYEIYHYNFTKKKGVLHADGRLDLHNETPIPTTLGWVEERARYGVAEWQTEEGSTCRAKIFKFATSSAGMQGSGAFGRIYIKGGVEDLGCEQYDPRTDPGTGTTTAGISSVAQTGGQFQSSLVPPGSTGQTTQSGQAIPGWYTTPGGQPPGVGGTSGSGPGTGGAGTGNLSNVTVSQQNVTITFWDHGQEDGDIINVYLNGNLIRGNVILKNTKMSFQVTLNSGQNNFEIEAVNEGRIPPNTASVKISHVTSGPATQIYERKSGARASMALTAP